MAAYHKCIWSSEGILATVNFFGFVVVSLGILRNNSVFNNASGMYNVCNHELLYLPGKTFKRRPCYKHRLKLGILSD